MLRGAGSSGKSVMMFNSYVHAIIFLMGLYGTGDSELSLFDNVYGFFGGQDNIDKDESYFLKPISIYLCPFYTNCYQMFESLNERLESAFKNHSRNTLKKDVTYLVKEGLLMRTGERSGTRYHYEE